MQFFLCSVKTHFFVYKSKPNFSLLDKKKSSISLFAPIIVFVKYSFFRAFSAYTSVLITYCMGSDLFLRPVNQQRRQLAVGHYSIVVFSQSQELVYQLGKLSWLCIVRGTIAEPSSLLHSVRDLKLYYNTLSATPDDISSSHSTF